MSRTRLALTFSAAMLCAAPAFAQDHAHDHSTAAGAVAAEAADPGMVVGAFHAALRAGDTATPPQASPITPYATADATTTRPCGV